MKPYCQNELVTLYYGNCLDILPSLKGSAIVTDPPYELGFMGKSWDSKGISFQSKTWEIIRKACISGAPLLSFGGTRTFHRIACAIEDAGWEIRDTLMWVTGQGFPKGHDIAWDIHKIACNSCGIMVEYDHAEENIRSSQGILSETEHSLRFVRAAYLQTPVYACSKCGQVLQPFLSEQEAQELRGAWEKSETVWPEQSSVEGRSNLEETKGELQRCSLCQMSHKILADGTEGWVYHGTSVGNGEIPWQIVNKDGSRPSYRPQSIEQYHNKPDTFRIERKAQTFRGWNVALKPAYEPIILAMNPLDGTFANNALKHGVAGLNIDECRVEYKSEADKKGGTPASLSQHRFTGQTYNQGKTGNLEVMHHQSSLGRFPANFIHDGSQMVMELFPNSVSVRSNRGNMVDIRGDNFGRSDKSLKASDSIRGYTDNGSAARFFYCAKASKAERNRGCEGLPPANLAGSNKWTDVDYRKGHGEVTAKPQHNNHPTVKPLALMEYLCKLVKYPEYNLIIDPFCGSGTTLMACIRLGIPCIGIDNDEASCEIAARRCSQEVMELV